MPDKDTESSAERDKDLPFHMQVPGPQFPPTPGKKLVFWAAESDSPGGREFEDIMLRRVPGAVAGSGALPGHAASPMPSTWRRLSRCTRRCASRRTAGTWRWQKC
jgi:hypothetical protein